MLSPERQNEAAERAKVKHDTVYTHCRQTFDVVIGSIGEREVERRIRFSQHRKQPEGNTSLG